MKKSILHLISLICISLIYSVNSNANCTLNKNFKGNIIATLPAKTYTLQYNDSTSRLLDTLAVQSNPAMPSAIIGYACNSQYSTEYLGPWKARYTGDKIIPTNISGIFIRTRIQNAPRTSIQIVPLTTGLIHFADSIPRYDWEVEIFKQGNVHNSGSLDDGALANYYQSSPSPILYGLITTVYIKKDSIKFNILNCSLKQSSYDINMGDWYDRQFKNIGDSSSNIDVPIKLSCMQGSNIKVTVSTNNIVDASSGKIGLNGNDKAAGIAIQLLDKNNFPIPLNTQKTLQNNVPDGDYIFGWKARYIKTDTNITPGTANATATVNVHYE